MHIAPPFNHRLTQQYISFITALENYHHHDDGQREMKEEAPTRNPLSSDDDASKEEDTADSSLDSLAASADS